MKPIDTLDVPWHALALDYLAQRLPQASEETLEQAIERAGSAEPQIANFLRQYQDLKLRKPDDLQSSPFVSFERIAEQLLRTLPAYEANVIRLFREDGLSSLPYSYLHFSPSDVQLGLESVLKESNKSD